MMVVVVVILGLKCIEWLPFGWWVGVGNGGKPATPSTRRVHAGPTGWGGVARAKEQSHPWWILSTSCVAAEDPVIK